MGLTQSFKNCFLGSSTVLKKTHEGDWKSIQFIQPSQSIPNDQIVSVRLSQPSQSNRFNQFDRLNQASRFNQVDRIDWIDSVDWIESRESVGSIQSIHSSAPMLLRRDSLCRKSYGRNQHMGGKTTRKRKPPKWLLCDVLTYTHGMISMNLWQHVRNPYFCYFLVFGSAQELIPFVEGLAMNQFVGRPPSCFLSSWIFPRTGSTRGSSWALIPFVGTPTKGIKS